MYAVFGYHSLTESETETILDVIQRKGLTWFGHVLRTEPEGLPYRALYCHVSGKEVEEDRQRGG